MIPRFRLGAPTSSTDELDLTNEQALRATLANLCDLGRLRPCAHRAALNLAAAIDAEPGKASLWAQYLDALRDSEGP